MEDSKHPVRIPDGELDDFIDRYLDNVGAARTPQVVLEDDRGRQVTIKPERGSAVLVSEFVEIVRVASRLNETADESTTDSSEYQYKHD